MTANTRTVTLEIEIQYGFEDEVFSRIRNSPNITREEVRAPDEIRRIFKDSISKNIYEYPNVDMIDSDIMDSSIINSIKIQ